MSHEEEKGPPPFKCDLTKDQGKRYYNYYDTPDGCDVDKKIGVVARYGVIAGIVAGTYDVLMYSHVIGLKPILMRYARHIVPLGLMGATFAAVANTVQQFRDADDPLNYFIGGASCGPLVALYTRSWHGLVPGAVFLGLAGLIKKEAIDHDFLLIQPYPNHMNMVDSWRHDWTLAKDPRDEMRHTCDLDFSHRCDHKKKEKEKCRD